MKEFKIGPLYAKASNDKTKMWECIVTNENDITNLIVKHGYINGKQAIDTRIIEPKNVGKSNETSTWDQGISEAKSKESKKRDKGYTEDSSTESSSVTLPMLAHKFIDKKHKIKWPAACQPKLNGVRCTTKIENNEIVYTSRGGKEYITVHFMDGAVKSFLDFTENISLDGEIFNPDFSLQEISSAVKKDREESKTLEYWIYDLVDTNSSFKDRNEKIKRFFDKYSAIKNSFGYRQYGSLIEVPTVIINNEQEMNDRHLEYISKGFEGTIIRNLDGLYCTNHRSIDLQKYKTFHEDEFEIVGAHEGTGNDIGTVVFECITKDNQIFSVRPKGSRELRREWLNNIDSIIGKLLTVKYQEVSDLSKNGGGIPIFPIGIVVRDYE